MPTTEHGPPLPSKRDQPEGPRGCLRINGDGKAVVIAVPVIDSALRPRLLPPLDLGD